MHAHGMKTDGLETQIRLGELTGGWIQEGQ